MDSKIYWGRITIAQKIGNIEKRTISNLVPNEIPESSQLSFRKVVNLHAIEAKLKIETSGVINGKTKINNINKAFIPKKNLNLNGTTPTVLSIASIVAENLLANNIKKNNQETLNTNGHKTFKIQKFNAGSSENHNLKSTKLKIRNIAIGTNMIEINTINLETIIPLTSLDIYIHHPNVIINIHLIQLYCIPL